VLANQLLANQAFGLAFLVEAAQVEQGDTEMLRGDFRDLAAFDQFVLDQIADEGYPIALGLLIRLLSVLVGNQLGGNQLLGQTGKGDIVHLSTKRKQSESYSVVGRWCQIGGG